MSDSLPDAAPTKSKRLPFFLLAGVLLVGIGEATRRWIMPVVELPISTVTDNRVLESEGLILDLTPRLKELLNTSVLNLKLPDALGVELFAEQATVNDPAVSAPHEKKHLPVLGVRKFSWDAGEVLTEVSGQDVSLWHPLIPF